MAIRLASWLRHRPGRLAVRIIAVLGLLAMAAATEPALWAAHGRALQAVLLLCQAGFLACLLATPRSLATLACALAVPLAYLLGGRPPLVWLAAGVWALPLAAAPEGLKMLARVVALEARPIAAVATLFAALLLGAATAAFLLEHHEQPDTFGSLPATLWWAVTTLTTTGYGDAVPRTPAGRLLAALVMVGGLSVFGLFTGILATGFAAESRRRDFLRSWDLVRRVPFLRALDSACLADVAAALRRIDIAADAVIFRRGRPGDCMYFIVDGEVEVELQPPRRLPAGSFFGELALLGDGTRSATVSTTHPTTLLVLDVADFRRLTARHPELAQAVQREAFHRAGDPSGYTPPADATNARELETEP